MQLHQQRDELKRIVEEAQAELQWMREHLASPKFQGQLEDNINVRDVDAFVLRTRNILDQAGDL